MLNNWLPWALLSACFAVLTTVFAKLGVEKIEPNYATFIRTLVIAIFIAALLLVTGGFQSPATLPRRAWLFLILSGFATGASWLCYFRAMSLGQAAEVAPVEKISVVLIAFRPASVWRRRNVGRFFVLRCGFRPAAASTAQCRFRAIPNL